MSAVATRPGWAAPATAAFATVAILVFGAYTWLAVSMPPSVPSATFTLVSALAVIVPYTVLLAISTVLLYKQPRNAVAWLLVAFTLFGPASGAGSYYVDHWLYAPDLPRALVVPLGLGGLLVSGLEFLPLALLPLIFPDGSLVSRRWRFLVWASFALTVVGNVALLDTAALGDGNRQAANPLAVPSLKGFIVFANHAGSLAFFVIFAAALVSLVIRYRRAGAELRHQIKWFGAGLAILVLCIVGGVITATTPNQTTPAPITFEIIGFSALPACIAVAVLKYRLYDIDVVINRALVYGALAAFITLVYVAIVVGIGTLVGSGGRPNLVLSIVATAVVAVGFQPVRERLQKVANRLVYGRRATPYEVLSEFSERVAETYAGEEVLPRMARVLADGTGAERAAVWLRSGDGLHAAAAWPESADGAASLLVRGHLLPAIPDTDRAVAVRHQGELLGALSVSKRKGESLTPIEEKLLDDLAHQAGLVLKNVGLTADLQRRLDELRASRQRLVAAQDEERRRLERNLHDGAQQNLVAIKVKLGLAEMMMTKDPQNARDLITALKADADEALQTLRDLARGIYPPLLADQGLQAAIQAQAGKATLPVTVEGNGVGRYPQEVEAAVYFCVLEALQNVQKYAGATSVIVRVSDVHDDLQFEVRDDGRGFDQTSVVRGAGLTNMDDRLDALGGKLTVTSEVGRFTLVSGSIPGRIAAAVP
jgi:signal transduction histidine kinase